MDREPSTLNVEVALLFAVFVLMVIIAPLSGQKLLITLIVVKFYNAF